MKTPKTKTTIPSEAIKHLDKDYNYNGFRCWSDKLGFHVELILVKKQNERKKR